MFFITQTSRTKVFPLKHCYGFSLVMSKKYKKSINEPVVVDKEVKTVLEDTTNASGNKVIKYVTVCQSGKNKGRLYSYAWLGSQRIFLDWLTLDKNASMDITIPANVL